MKTNLCDARGSDSEVAADLGILGCSTVWTRIVSITRHTIQMKGDELGDAFSTSEINKILVLGKSWNI